MTKVTVDIEQLRGAASSLSSSATTIEEKYNTLVNSANAVYVPTESLASVPGYVEDLRDKSKTLDAKVDLAILINSGDTGNVPQSGTLSYEVDGADPTDLVGMEYAIGRAMADMGQEMAPHLEHILETYLLAVASAYVDNNGKRPEKDADGDGVVDLLYTETMPSGEQVPNSPWFSADALNHALGLIGRDSQALLDMRHAVNKAEAEGVTAGMTDDQFTTHATRWSAVEGAFANAVGTGALEDAQAKDDYALAWIELGQSAASEGAGAAGAGKNPVTSIGSGMLIEELAERARETWAKNAKDETAKQKALAEQALQDYRMRLQFAADAAGLNGYQDENSGEALTDAVPEDATDGVVTDPDGTVRLITQEEYNALSEADQSVAYNSLQSLSSSPVGLSKRVPASSIETTFNNEFIKRFS